MDPNTQFFLLTSCHALLKALLVMFVLGAAIRIIQPL
jgi:hypothetical protein